MTDNKNKVKITALKISFLMKHQDILPDLKEIALELAGSNEYINYNSPEYLQGAADALLSLIVALEQKGI